MKKPSFGLNMKEEFGGVSKFRRDFVVHAKGLVERYSEGDRKSVDTVLDTFFNLREKCLTYVTLSLMRFYQPVVYRPLLMSANY